MKYQFVALIAAIGLIFCLLMVLVVRAYWITPFYPAVSPAPFESDDERSVHHLAEALRFETISYRNADALNSGGLAGGPV